MPIRALQLKIFKILLWGGYPEPPLVWNGQGCPFHKMENLIFGSPEVILGCFSEIIAVITVET